jgi:hypothetical protein
MDVADADAVAEGIVPCAKSSSCTATCMVDCIELTFIMLSSVKADGTALVHSSACQWIWLMPMLWLKELFPGPKVQVVQ